MVGKGFATMTTPKPFKDFNTVLTLLVMTCAKAFTMPCKDLHQKRSEARKRTGDMGIDHLAVNQYTKRQTVSFSAVNNSRLIWSLEPLVMSYIGLQVHEEYVSILFTSVDRIDILSLATALNQTPLLNF
jgi:hypothetical protein